MSLQNSIMYAMVTNTGIVFNSSNNANGTGYVIHGYSLKSSGASATIDIQDQANYIASIPLTSAATGLLNMFPVGIKCVGNVSLSGVSTNISNITLFYNKE